MRTPAPENTIVKNIQKKPLLPSNLASDPRKYKYAILKTSAIQNNDSNIDFTSSEAPVYIIPTTTPTMIKSGIKNVTLSQKYFLFILSISIGSFRLMTRMGLISIGYIITED